MAKVSNTSSDRGVDSLSSIKTLKPSAHQPQAVTNSVQSGQSLSPTSASRRLSSVKAIQLSNEPTPLDKEAQKHRSKVSGSDSPPPSHSKLASPPRSPVASRAASPDSSLHRLVCGFFSSDFFQGGH